MSKLPRKPLLKAYINIIPLTDEMIQLSSQENIMLLKGSAVTQVLPELLPLLNGETNLEEIYAKLSNCTEKVINQAILLLKEHFIIEDNQCKYESKLSEDEIKLFNKELNFFSLFSERVLPNASTVDKYKILEKLKFSKCLVIGLGNSGSHITKTLVENGMGNMFLFDGRDVNVDMIGTIYKEDDLNKSRCEVVEKIINNINKKCNIVKSKKFDDTSLEEMIKEVDFVILSEDISVQSMHKKVNKLCINHNKPWISMRAGELRFQVGPLIVPKQTACYTCFQNRLNGNLSFYDEQMAFEKYKELNSEKMHVSTLDLFYSISASFLTWEVIKFITKIFSPVTLSRVITFDVLSLETNLDTVLKMPRCSDCSDLEHEPFIEPYAVYLP
ncbi:TOMM precursor leader peptide-binding protein [Clostridium algidicarnis]|uniref:TOMM precursor leader peptide-binding protein n=1 Tax=Clostridium algidicarnis TaxID=37659 RepID=UPI000497F942|nr:TOMM precursor leader peptide-binding protein [Clostridium algidicarnis]